MGKMGVVTTDELRELMREELTAFFGAGETATSEANAPDEIGGSEITGKLPPTVFISYSHPDEVWKNRLVSHLGVLQREGLLDIWEDRRIGASADWEAEIAAALARAKAAVLLISANFLNSNFILTKEAPLLLQRRMEEGLPVIPVIVRSCAWEKVSWLSPINAPARRQGVGFVQGRQTGRGDGGYRG